MSNGIDGEGGDEWPKVQDAARSLRELLKDDFERADDPSSRRKSDEELVEDLFGILSQWESNPFLSSGMGLINSVFQ